MQGSLAVQAARPEGSRSWQLLVPIHREHHPIYGLVEYTPERILQMAENFRAGVKTYHGRLPFTIAHQEDRGAGGWIEAVEARPDGLWGEVEWTGAGVEAIESEAYPFISPEIRDVWTDPVTGTAHRDVFEGASLVVRPQFRELPPAVVQAFDEDPTPAVWVMAGAATGLTVPVDGEEEQMSTQQEAAAGAPAAEAGAELLRFAEMTSRLAAVEAEAGELRAKGEAAAAENAALRRQVHTDAYRRQFGEVRLSGRPLAPVSRGAAAELAADLHQVSPELAKRFGEFLAGLQTYASGEAGADAAAAQVVALDPELKAFGEDLGLSPEDLARGQETTTWRR